jgi:hypothetical protein
MQHGMFDQAIRDVSPEQFHFVPTGTKANSIAFTIWHYVRTEDNIVNFILQDRKPTVWIDGGWHEKFGLHKAAQGTGMSVEDAHAMDLKSVDEWMPYQQGVWQATDAYLLSLDDAALDRVTKVVPFGDIPVRRALTQVCLTHGHAHMGEICVLRVLQGLESSLI